MGGRAHAVSGWFLIVCRGNTSVAMMRGNSTVQQFSTSPRHVDLAGKPNRQPLKYCRILGHAAFVVLFEFKRVPDGIAG